MANRTVILLATKRQTAFLVMSGQEAPFGIPQDQGRASPYATIQRRHRPRHCVARVVMSGIMDRPYLSCRCSR